jgi:SAM-dependent methyltransferase
MTDLGIDWESRYRQGTTGWQRTEVNPAFIAWRADGTLTPCRILVPGAGRSAEPLALAEAGFDVTAIDIAPSAVEYQRERLSPFGGKSLGANLLQWEPEAPFDAIYEQTCLCALPPALWEDYAACLARWLRPAGVLAALFMQTGREGGPPFHCDLPRMRMLFPPPIWLWPAELPATIDRPPVGMSEQPAALKRA